MKRFFINVWNSPLLDVSIGLVVMSSIGLAIWKVSMSSTSTQIENAVSTIITGVAIGFVGTLILFGAWFVGLIVRSIIEECIRKIKHRQ